MVKALVAAWTDPASTRTWSGVTARLMPLLAAQGIDIWPFEVRPGRPLVAAARSLNLLSSYGQLWRDRGLLRPALDRRLSAAVDACQPDVILHIARAWCSPARSRRRPAPPEILLCDTTWHLIRTFGTALSGLSAAATRDLEKNERTTLSRMSHIFVLAGHVKDDMVAWYGINPDRVTVAGTGPGGATPYTGPKDYARGHVLFVAKGTHTDKGASLLIEGFRSTRERLPDRRLLMVGRDDLVRMARGDPRIDVTGYIPREHLQRLFEDAALFAMPAYNEPLGMVYLEALVTRTPVLGLDRRALPEITLNGRFGFLISDANPAAVGDAIVNALSDPARLELMGRDGQAHVLGLYSWERMASTIATRMIGLAADA
jgi:glycosyltransferase involved in cell wall biosynthesis